MAVSAKILFHPCSGDDWKSSHDCFGSHVRELWFCDPVYKRRPPRNGAPARFMSDDARDVLDRLEPRSIGVFVHTGDSPGEGGSDLWFLSESPTGEYQPAGLFDRLGPKLADQALIVSDGSNCDIARASSQYCNRAAGSEEAYSKEKDKGPFPFGGFEWSCVGYLPQKNGPTLVWSVKRSGRV